MEQFFLDKIHLSNFRNFENQTIALAPKINCIFGNNGNGKTNLLEAIYYLSYKKSFRKKVSYQHIINVECENPEIIISSVFKNLSEEQFSYSGKITTNGSEWYLNNKPHKGKIDLKSILINPFDSFLFHSTSSFRRAWVDQHLSVLSKEYKTVLNKYNTALRFRNNLISKKPPQYREQINSIDSQFCELTFNLINLRKILLKELNQNIGKTFKAIFDESHQLELDIDSKFANFSVENIVSFYQNSIEKDLIIGHTSSGAHRDDYTFHFDGYNSYEYCSLGQQKMSFLSLLFAYIELFRYKFKTYPIVLIDDVSGELDQRRWIKLIKFLESNNFQVLITTANENFKTELEKIQDAQKIFIHDGRIEIL